MTLPELKQLWSDRLSRFAKKKFAATDERDRINFGAKAAELTECIHELGQLDEATTLANPVEIAGFQDSTP